MSDYRPPIPPRSHDSSDCYATYSTTDGCESDCDCSCHTDSLNVIIQGILGMPRR